MVFLLGSNSGLQFLPLALICLNAAVTFGADTGQIEDSDHAIVELQQAAPLPLAENAVDPFTPCSLPSMPGQTG